MGADAHQGLLQQTHQEGVGDPLARTDHLGEQIPKQLLLVRVLQLVRRLGQQLRVVVRAEYVMSEVLKVFAARPKFVRLAGGLVAANRLDGGEEVLVEIWYRRQGRELTDQRKLGLQAGGHLLDQLVAQVDAVETLLGGRYRVEDGRIDQLRILGRLILARVGEMCRRQLGGRLAI